tara:strand:+ start:304 stop:528 length:225 start_codon:yes stop_codon:yes gene_type:complete
MRVPIERLRRACFGHDRFVHDIRSKRKGATSAAGPTRRATRTTLAATSGEGNAGDATPRTSITRPRSIVVCGSL